MMIPEKKKIISDYREQGIFFFVDIGNNLLFLTNGEKSVVAFLTQ